MHEHLYSSLLIKIQPWSQLNLQQLYIFSGDVVCMYAKYAKLLKCYDDTVTIAWLQYRVHMAHNYWDVT